MVKKKLKTNDGKWKFKAAIVIAALFGFSYLLWYSYYIHIDNVKEEDLPIVQAPLNIISKPQDPGGVIIPNKDKDIYNHMSGRKIRNERIKTSKLSKDNLSKSEALSLITKQLKKGEIATAFKSAKSMLSKQKTPELIDKTYYLRIAKLTNASVKNKALKILQNKYPVLNKLDGKLYKEKNILGKTKYYLHVGPINKRTVAKSLCGQLIKAGKSCKVFQ